MAVVFGSGAAAKDIGVGAPMGGLLALATVAYGVTGWMMLARRRRTNADAMAAAKVPVGAPAGDTPTEPSRRLRAAGAGDEPGDLAKLARDPVPGDPSARTRSVRSNVAPELPRRRDARCTRTARRHCRSGAIQTDLYDVPLLHFDDRQTN